MASDTPNEEDQAGESHEPRECMPCRGTGRVISNLGGTPSQVECPWCGGAGTRVAGIDAQARWPTEADTAAQAAGGAASAGESSAPDAEPDQAA